MLQMLASLMQTYFLALVVVSPRSVLLHYRIILLIQT
jgi:hypothetical protein